MNELQKFQPNGQIESKAIERRQSQQRVFDHSP